MFSRPLGQWTARRFLVTLGIGGVGAYFAYLGAVDWYRGVRSDAWPTAGGRVLQSEIQRVSGRGRIASGYKAHVLYRYEVDGRSYIGDVVSFGHLALGTGEGNAESLTHQYPRGSAGAGALRPRAARPGNIADWLDVECRRQGLPRHSRDRCRVRPRRAKPRPNKRLKLAGVIVFNGGRCVVALGWIVYRSAVDEPAVQYARSLSAIR